MAYPGALKTLYAIVVWIASYALVAVIGLFQVSCLIVIRELITWHDVMEDLGLGSYGGCMYCMDHLEDWLTEEVDNFMDNVLDRCSRCIGEV